MKFISLVVFGLLFFSSYFCGRETVNESSNLKADKAKEKSKSDPKENKVAVKVNEYENNVLKAEYIFDENGKLKQKTVFDEKNKSKNSVTKYFYKRTGEFERAEFNAGEKEDSDEIFNKTISDFQSSVNYLKTQNIKISFPELLSNEIGGTAKMLSIGENNNDFKKDVNANNSEKTIRYSGINQTVRFYPADVGVAEDEIIEDYELILKDGYPVKETYKTGKSSLKGTDSDNLTTEYFYDDNNRVSKEIFTSSSMSDNKESKSVVEKRFEYQDLK